MGIVGMVWFISLSNRPAPAATMKTVTIRNSIIRVEVAETNIERARGLSGRESLAPDAGMLFIFDRPGRYSFWMKGMQFPLDFIYIRENRVVELRERVPLPADIPTPFSPEREFDAVLEVNAGWVAQNGIAIGEKVTF